MSVNDDFVDKIVAHDINVYRAIGDVRNQVNQRLQSLGVELRAAVVKSRVYDAVRSSTRKKRQAALEKESKRLIDEAYKEISDTIIQSGKELTKLERDAITSLLQEMQ